MKPFRLTNSHCLQKKQCKYLRFSFIHYLGDDKKLCKVQQAVIRKRLPGIRLDQPPQWVNFCCSYGEKP